MRAVEPKVTDRAGIGAAFVFLQRVDDLHGPDFRRATDGAGGKCGPQHIIGTVRGIELARDVRHDVHHVAVTLHDHEIVHADLTMFGDAAHVVAREIHEHEVLGALLGIG